MNNLIKQYIDTYYIPPSVLSEYRRLKRGIRGRGYELVDRTTRLDVEDDRPVVKFDYYEPSDMNVKTKTIRIDEFEDFIDVEGKKDEFHKTSISDLTRYLNKLKGLEEGGSESRKKWGANKWLINKYIDSSKKLDKIIKDGPQDKNHRLHNVNLKSVEKEKENYETNLNDNILAKKYLNLKMVKSAYGIEEDVARDIIKSDVLPEQPNKKDEVNAVTNFLINDNKGTRITHTKVKFNDTVGLMPSSSTIESIKTDIENSNKKKYSDNIVDILYYQIVKGLNAVKNRNLSNFRATQYYAIPKLKRTIIEFLEYILNLIQTDKKISDEVKTSIKNTLIDGNSSKSEITPKNNIIKFYNSLVTMTQLRYIEDTNKIDLYNVSEESKVKKYGDSDFKPLSVISKATSRTLPLDTSLDPLKEETKKANISFYTEIVSFTKATKSTDPEGPSIQYYISKGVPLVKIGDKTYDRFIKDGTSSETSRKKYYVDLVNLALSDNSKRFENGFCGPNNPYANKLLSLSRDSNMELSDNIVEYIYANNLLKEAKEVGEVDPVTGEYKKKGIRIKMVTKQPDELLGDYLKKLQTNAKANLLPKGDTNKELLKAQVERLISSDKGSQNCFDCYDVTNRYAIEMKQYDGSISGFHTKCQENKKLFELFARKEENKIKDDVTLKREFYRTQQYHYIPITCNKFNTLYSIVKDTIKRTKKAIKQYNELYDKEITFESIFGEGDEGIKRWEDQKTIRDLQGQQFVPYFVNGKVQYIVNATNQTATKDNTIKAELEELSKQFNNYLKLHNHTPSEVLKHSEYRKVKGTENDSNVLSGGFVDPDKLNNIKGLEFLIVVNTTEGIVKYNYSNDNLIIADIPGSVYSISYPADIRHSSKKPVSMDEKKAYCIPIDLFEFVSLSSQPEVAASSTSKKVRGKK